MDIVPVFADPHPLGLPAHRYSHQVRLLGSGAFGQVYLCCLRSELPPLDPDTQLEPQQPHPSGAGSGACTPSGQPCHGGGSIEMVDYHSQQEQQQQEQQQQDHHQQQQQRPTHIGGAPDGGSSGSSGHAGAAGALWQPGGSGGAAPVAPAHAPAPRYDYQWVAVKIYKPLVDCNLRDLEYLKREVLCQRRLDHAHVIGFREVGITTSICLYLCLEYANGGNLKAMLAQQPGGRLAEAAARWFTQQLVYGLAYCHSRGVCNRDVKPENLLLHNSEMGLPLLKVADFGLCKREEDSVPNSCVGSPNYMAPEVFTSKKYDGRKADVFSCGVVLYQMVFGALPFSRSADGRQLDFKRHSRDIVANMRRDSWRELLPQPAVCVSDSLLDLLAGMLRFDPDKRLSLYDVKRHAWYREGLTPDIYQMLLSGDEDPAAPASAEQTDGGDGGAGEAAHGQSAALIEAEFARILQHCTALQRDKAARDVDGELEDGI